MTERVNKLIVNQLIAGSGADTTSSPAISFGDADTGIFETSDDSLRLVIAGSNSFGVIADQVFGTANSSPSILNETATYTNPTLVPNRAGGTATGLGGVSNELSLISNGTETLRISGTEMFIPNGRTTNPTTISTGGWLFVSGGSLQFVGSSGTVTRLALP